MQVFKGGVILLIITLILFLTTSSMASIREDLLWNGVKRIVPGGPDPLHHSADPPRFSPKYRRLYGVERKIYNPIKKLYISFNSGYRKAPNSL